MGKKIRYRKGVPGAPKGYRKQVMKFDGKDYFLKGSYRHGDARMEVHDARVSGYNARMTGPYKDDRGYPYYKVWLRKKTGRRR